MQTTIIINRTRISSLDDLRENFNSAEFLAYLKSGRMIKWLNEHGESTLAEKISTINAEDKSSVKTIMEILSIAEDKCPVQKEPVIPEKREKKVLKRPKAKPSVAYAKEARTREEKKIADGRDRLLSALNEIADTVHTNFSVQTPFSSCDIPATEWDGMIENVIQSAGLTSLWLQAKENLKTLECATAQNESWMMPWHSYTKTTWRNEHEVIFTANGLLLVEKKKRKSAFKITEDLENRFMRRKIKFWRKQFTVADLIRILYCGSKQLIPFMQEWKDLDLDSLLIIANAPSSPKAKVKIACKTVTKKTAPGKELAIATRVTAAKTVASVEEAIKTVGLGALLRTAIGKK